MLEGGEKGTPELYRKEWGVWGGRLLPVHSYHLICFTLGAQSIETESLLGPSAWTESVI